VYPIGFGLILLGTFALSTNHLTLVLGSLVSRYRNKDKEVEDEDEKKLKMDRSIRMHKAMERLDFATKPVDERKRMKSEYEDEY
jgi:hypothetical protein